MLWLEALRNDRVSNESPKLVVRAEEVLRVAEPAQGSVPAPFP
jgi:hypothetical protein